MKTKIFTKARGLMMLILATMISTKVWAATEDFEADGADLSEWSGSHSGQYSGDGSLKLDATGEDAYKLDIWSGTKSSQMTALTVVVNAKINGTGSASNEFTVDALDKDGNVLATKKLTGNWGGSYDDHEFVLVGTFANVTGLKLTYTKKEGGNVGIASITATITYTTNYTVTYDGNGKTGGTVPTDASSPYAPSSTVTVLGNTGSLVRTGCTFSGWNTAADGSGTTYPADGSGSFTITANTTLYAKWAATVTWNDNGGNIRTDNIFVPAAGKSVTPPSDPSTSARGNCGDKFMGWTTTENYKSDSPSPGDIVTGEQVVMGNTTYYAVFADYAE